MRSIFVLAILNSQFLPIVAGRCRTVWHEANSQTSFHNSDSGPCAHGSDKVDHAVTLTPWSTDDHGHESGTPGHSHVVEPDLSRSAPRAQSIVPELIAPTAYAELSSLIAQATTSLAQPAIAIDDDCTRARQLPSSGRISHLLF